MENQKVEPSPNRAVFEATQNVDKTQQDSKTLSIDKTQQSNQDITKPYRTGFVLMPILS
jgi:hypothetical protein